jgi:hypothetical protein
MLHVFEATITANHCPRIVFSITPRSGEMHFCRVALGPIKRSERALLVFFLVVNKSTSMDGTPVVRHGRGVGLPVPSGFESNGVLRSLTALRKSDYSGN